MFEKNRGGMRRQTLLLASIVILLAMFLSFTLAWFAQLLVSRGNRVEAGSAMGEFVELWAQSAEPEANGGRYGTQFAPISFPTSPDAANVYVAPVVYEDKLMQTSYKQIQPGQLYKLVKAVPEGQDALVYGDKSKGEYNRLLDDEYLLPGKTITRRLIVRNLSEQPMSYTVSFADFAEDAAFQELSEAILVDTKRITAEAPSGKPDAALTGISAAQLKETTVSGELAGGKYDVYELSFTFAGTATDFYAAKSLSLDVKVVANGGKTTHYISAEEELVKLLSADGGLQHGETIALNQDVTLHSDFVTDRMINLDLRGFTLKVEGIFLIDVTAAADYDPAQGFGTIDIAYDGNGKLLVGNGVTGDPKAVGVRAPKAAVRWIAKKGADGDYISTMPDLATNVDARVFNGKEARNPEAVMPTSTPVSGITIDAGLNLTFLEADQTKDSLSFVATATKASADDQDPTFYATSTDESVAVVESVEQPYTPEVSTFGVGDPQALARITLRRVSNDPSKSCKILVRAGSASAEVIVNIGVGVTSFSLPETGFVQPNPASGTENTLPLTASDFLPADAVEATKTIVKWESSDKSLAIVIPDETDPNKAVVKPAFTVDAVDKIGQTVTVTAISMNGTRQSCEVTLGRKATSVTLSTTELTLSPKAASGAAAGSVSGANETFDLASRLAVGPDDTSRKDVTWSSGDPSVATVDANGLVRAVVTTADYAKFGSQCTITATAKDGSGLSASCTVTVGVPVGTIGTAVNECTVNPKGKGTDTSLNSASVGLVLNPKAKYLRAGGVADDTVAWIETDVSGAPVAEAAKKLVLSPDASKNNEQCAVSAKSETIGDVAYFKATLNGMETSVCTVHIGKSVTAVSFAAGTPSQLDLGATGTLSASVTPTDATIPDVTYSVVTKRFDGTAANLMTIDPKTGAYSVNASTPGKAVVTASATDGSGKTVTQNITLGVAVTKITVTAPAAVPPGTTAKATAVLEPANASVKTVTWTLEGETAGSPAPTGLSIAADGTITAASDAPAGAKFRVVATANDYSGVSDAKESITWMAVSSVSLAANPATIYTASSASTAKTATVTATVSPADSTAREVSWSISPASGAALGAQTSALDSQGKATVTLTATEPGTYTVTGTIDGKTATCAVTVVQQVTGVSLNETTWTVTRGASNVTKQLTATVAPTNANNKAVTWKSSNTAVATVSTTGLVTAVGPGSATITVTTTDQGKTATCAVTVTQQVTGITVSRTSGADSGWSGTTAQLSASVQPTNANNRNVTWSTSNGNIATVSTSGLVTFKSTPGTATITATAQDGSGKTGTYSVTSKGIKATSVSVTLKSGASSGWSGGTCTLQSAVSPSNYNTANQAISWGSSNTNVATVNSSTGVVTFGNTAGDATITCYVKEGSTTTASGTYKVTSKGIKATGASISGTSSGWSGATSTLSPGITPSGYTAASHTLSWSTSNSSVASVDSGTGKVTFGSTAGNATITLTVKDKAANTTLFAKTYSVTSKGIKATGASISGTSSGWSGATSTLSPGITPSNYTAASHTLSWSSNNTSVASVNSSTGVVTFGNTAGTATITLTVKDKAANTTLFTKTYTVTSKGIKATGASISGTSSGWSGATSTLSPGITPSTYTAASHTLTWSSGNTNVATVNSSTGVVTFGSTAGSATITLTVKDKVANTTLFTKTYTVTSKGIKATGASISGTNTGWSGETSTLSPGITPSGYTAASHTLSWSSSNTSVASVNSGTGVVTFGNTAGTATITLTVKDKAANTTLFTKTYSVTSKGKPAVGDEYTYKGVKWVVANISGSTYTLLYHDTPLDRMVWNASDSNASCEITAAGLRDNIKGKAPGSTLGSSDNLFLPTTGNLGSPSGAEYDPDAGKSCWALFADNSNETRKTYITSFSSITDTWTATPYSYNSYRVWIVFSYGSLSNRGSANNSLGVVPALNVNL